MASIDPLTKLHNRQHLHQVVENEFLRYDRYGVPFSIAIIDSYRFKRVNDDYGHQEGDAVLIKISREISANLRELDICARYGGEEFMIVLPHRTVEITYELAERMRGQIERMGAAVSDVTLSIGVAGCPWNAASVEAVTAAADSAAYASKEPGK
jgi:diguanylate cyclase (GGDEF)-like protein